MSDLFHPKVPLGFIRDVFEVIADTPRHQYQVLTKRSQRLAAVAGSLSWPGNLWMGVSVESDRYAFRIEHLRQLPAAVRFLSCEPLLGPLEGLDLTGVHWVIVGGESGAGARPVSPAWVRSVRDQCEDSGRTVLLQTVGWAQPQGGRTRARRGHSFPNAKGIVNWLLKSAFRR